MESFALQSLHAQLRAERQLAMARHSDDEVTHGSKLKHLREQLDEQMEAASKAIQARQHLESDFAAFQVKAKHDLEASQEKLVKSHADLAVANCEMETCKKQVTISPIRAYLRCISWFVSRHLEQTACPGFTLECTSFANAEEYTCWHQRCLVPSCLSALYVSTTCFSLRGPC